MSHSSGAVKFQDGLILHCEYDGTVDVMISALYDTQEEMRSHWREYPRWNNCKCNPSYPEKVEIATSYGRGFSYKGVACRICRAVLDARDEYDEQYYIEDNLPQWFPDYNLYK